MATQRTPSETPRRICDYCGEYEHDCKCKGAKTITKITAELEQLKHANGEMLEKSQAIADALQGFLGNGDIENEIKLARQALYAFNSVKSAIPPTPTIPIDVAQKMYEALKEGQFMLDITMNFPFAPAQTAQEGSPKDLIDSALSLAQQHGLGKEKP